MKQSRPMKSGEDEFKTIFAEKVTTRMIAQPPFLRRYAARLVAIALIFALYALAQLPEISKAERNALAKNIHFNRLPLSEVSGPAPRSFRQVNPSLQKITGWISTVGAAVALNDLDGDGLPNDICHVDTRTDQVVVAPVPGTAARYQPFVLDPGPDLYDRKTMAPMGCLPGDLNEDGLMDIIVYYWGRTPVAFLRKPSNNSNNTLSEVGYRVQEIVPGKQRWYTNAATLADLDGDGHVDLIVGNYFQDGARILDASSSEIQQMQHSMSRASNGGRNRLLRWEGASAGEEPSVRYAEAERAIEGDEDGKISRGWTLAVSAADLDGDLLPEIYFANDFGSDHLLHNRSKPGAIHLVPLEGSRTMMTPGSKVLGRDSFKGMGADFGDLNGDGIPDIVVSNIAEEYALEESHFAFLSKGTVAPMQRGVAPYVEQSEALGLSRSGWGWDLKLGDFNNDGNLELIQATGFLKGNRDCWPELHELAMGNDQMLQKPLSWPAFRPGGCGLSYESHDPFFMRAADGRFYDLAREVGLDSAQISRGIATADVDGDGRLDFAVANQWDTSYFYHNESTEAGQFIGLHLLLPLNPTEPGPTRVCSGHPRASLAGRPATGAQAVLYLPDNRRLVAQVDGGNGHSGKRSFDLQFGLGPLQRNPSLRVDLRWRDASGAIRTETLQLSPGWYTVLLGGPERKDYECE
jgi:hypothetical protein